MLAANSNARLRRNAGFTLIEMLVVIAIIAILMTAIVAVGSMVRTNVLTRHTLAELKVLDGVMQEYINDGNAEPTPTATPWPYTVPNGQFVRTKPDSDVTNWVAALTSNTKYSKKISTFTTDTDAGGVPSSTRGVILDAFGNPVRYVNAASSPSGIGYFLSAGPDGKFSNAADPISDTLLSSPSRADEIYSYDP